MDNNSIQPMENEHSKLDVCTSREVPYNVISHANNLSLYVLNTLRASLFPSLLSFSFAGIIGASSHRFSDLGNDFLTYGTIAVFACITAIIVTLFLNRLHSTNTVKTSASFWIAVFVPMTIFSWMFCPVAVIGHPLPLTDTIFQVLLNCFLPSAFGGAIGLIASSDTNRLLNLLKVKSAQQNANALH